MRFFILKIIKQFCFKDYVEFKYKCAALNGKQCPIEKLLLKASFPMTSLDCNQRSCVGFITDYVAYDPEGRKSKMTVDYQDQTLYPTTFVYKNGNDCSEF
jgi:hypothetical protein